MSAWSAVGPTALAAFMAATVEFVEALTVVLAVGVTRGWRPALAGAALGLATLAALVVALGASLPAVPLAPMRLVLGGLLLLFGLRWLRKAILRAAGVLALHDEAATFAKETRALAATPGRRGALDGLAALTAFKSVVVEGLEVVFIVVAMGGNGGALVPAATGALLALACVAALGLALHRPLARVPENTLKFGVGVMLSAFGAFWVGEGAGVGWPGEDLAILALLALTLAAALGLVRAARAAAARARAAAPGPAPAPAPAASAPAGPIRAAVREALGLVVDDPALAFGALVAVGLGWVAAAVAASAAAWPGGLLFAGLLAALARSVLRRASRGP